MKAGLSEVQTSLKQSFQTQLNSSADCPDSGSATLEKLFEKKGGIMSAVGTVQGVIKLTEPKSAELRADQSKCGTCTQSNIVSPFAAVNPEKVIEDLDCSNMPKETFTGVFNNTQEIQSYTQDVLQGNNDDGERLLDGCPDPCAYYITTAQTPVAGGKQHLTLTVQCGNPRRDSIFSASYSYKAGVIHNWACVKK